MGREKPGYTPDELEAAVRTLDGGGSVDGFRENVTEMVLDLEQARQGGDQIQVIVDGMDLIHAAVKGMGGREEVVDVLPEPGKTEAKWQTILAQAMLGVALIIKVAAGKALKKGDVIQDKQGYEENTKLARAVFDRYKNSLENRLLWNTVQRGQMDFRVEWLQSSLRAAGILKDEEGVRRIRAEVDGIREKIPTDEGMRVARRSALLMFDWRYAELTQDAAGLVGTWRRMMALHEPGGKYDNPDRRRELTMMTLKRLWKWRAWGRLGEVGMRHGWEMRKGVWGRGEQMPR